MAPISTTTTLPKQPLKRYICSFCARTFSRSEHKLRHERSHTKEKPFDCKICSSAFVRRDLLQRHCRTVHGVVLKTNNQHNSISNGPSDQQQQQQQQPLLLPILASQDTHFNNNVETNHTPHPSISSSSSSSSVLSEKNIISLLTLCKKFNYLTIPYELDNAICNYFLTYGTRCHNILPLIKFDRILNLNENDELLFIILCIGANENNNLLDSIKLFNKSWSIINDKINNHKIDYNSENIDEFVENVIMLSFIYLNYFDNYFDQDTLTQNITVEIDVLFEYLNSVIITQILNEGRTNGLSFSVEELCERQFPIKLNYWHAHILLLQYCFIYNKPPSILHSFLLNKILPIEDGVDLQSTLSQFLKNLTVSSYKYNNSTESKLFKKLGLIDNIIINSLMNELLIMKQKNQPISVSYSTTTITYFEDNKNFLHNSIILANKSFNHTNEDDESQTQQQQSSTEQQQQHHHNQYNMNQSIGLLNDGLDNLTVFSRNNHLGNWTVSNRQINNLPYIQFLNMLIMCKRKMLINCPLKFIDLISNYVFLPKDQSNWVLLNLTLKEFNNDNNSNKFDSNGDIISSQFFNLKNFIDLSNLSRSDLGITQISENINAYINCLYPSSFVINNNLGIATLPMLYLSLNTVNNNLVNFKNFLNLPSNKQLTVGFVVENFLTLIRILVNYRYRLFNMNTTSIKTTSSPTTTTTPLKNSNGSYNSNDMLITSSEGFLENSILSVILYFMDQCGSNVLSKLPAPKNESKVRPRSNSISLGEFGHNSERLKQFSLLDKFDDDPKTTPEYPPLVKILANDFKYYYYLKNLENALINWLNVFIIDPVIMAGTGNMDHLLRYKNFIDGLQKSLKLIYDQLDLSHSNNQLSLQQSSILTSPDLKPRSSNLNELDFQQQQLQQQSFTGLLGSNNNNNTTQVNREKNHELLNLQQKQYHQQLNLRGFTNPQQLHTQLHHQKIILPPIVPQQQQQKQAESGLQYPSPRPSIVGNGKYT